MTLKEQIVQLSGDSFLKQVPKTLREEIVFLAEDHLGGETINNSGNYLKEI